MSLNIVSLKDVRPSPWRNLGGVTHELVTWPKGERWVWRMSVAQIDQNGPFSCFVGVQRWFAVLDGAGVCLTLDQRTYDLRPHSAPLSFDGGTPLDCRLTDGPAQAFNLMLQRDQASALMMRVNGSQTTCLKTSKIIAVYAIDTGANIQFDHEILTLPAATLAWRHGPAGTRLQIKSKRALLMLIEPETAQAQQR
ncbi:MAG: HutD family protein [Comamonadaceae bacterium]|nr:HutD family protein [Comamonadaceae bacterium]